MDRCQHCEHAVAPEAPYCPACGQPRMLASLLAPRRRPAWQGTAWRAVAAVGLGWFLVVACVAFLRESKALRVARGAIEIGQIQPADAILTRFLGEHPEDDEGLFLASRAAVRLEDLPRTADLRGRLQEEDADRLEELDADIRGALDASIRTRACSAQLLLAFYDETDALGETFHPAVLGAMQQAVRRCLVSEKGSSGGELTMAGLVKRKVDPSFVEETFRVPLRNALDEGRYDEAELLAVEAALISTDAGQAMDPVLSHVRGRVEASVAHLEELCRAISSAPESPDEGGRCFPASPPSLTAVTLDGWGHRLTYQALAPDEDADDSCSPGFELTSLGADGRETDEEDTSPNADITCRFDGRRRLLGLPDSFWRRQP